jgi:hypothetical protein
MNLRCAPFSKEQKKPPEARQNVFGTGAAAGAGAGDAVCPVNGACNQSTTRTQIPHRRDDRFNRSANTGCSNTKGFSQCANTGCSDIKGFMQYANTES